MVDCIEFFYKDSCLITRDEIEAVGLQLLPEIVCMRGARQYCYETEYAAINLSYDTDMQLHINRVLEEKRVLGITILVVIGIGGSNLGTIAIHEAIHRKFYNERNRADLRVYFVDTVDPDEIAEFIIFLECELKRGNEVLFNVVSKSGTTMETLINFELLLNILKIYRPDTYHQYAVVTTEKSSLLWEYGQKEKMSCLAIPKSVGGRYSVFSAVGLFPLGLLGINTHTLCEGARVMTDRCTTGLIFDNPAALSAILCAILYKRGFTIHDTFLFSPSLESFGKWYRQLMGESIGKAYDRDGMLVNVGITPTVSLGSVDLHSVGQLYLGGPYDKYTTFVSVDEYDYECDVHLRGASTGLVSEAYGKSLTVIMDAILKGTQVAYRKQERPFASIILPEKNEFYIGQLMQMKMIEMMYLGYLLNIDPFDQPQVELYKKETRDILRQM